MEPSGRVKLSQRKLKSGPINEEEEIAKMLKVLNNSKINWEERIKNPVHSLLQTRLESPEEDAVIADPDDLSTAEWMVGISHLPPMKIDQGKLIDPKETSLHQKFKEHLKLADDQKQDSQDEFLKEKSGTNNFYKHVQ